MKRLALLALLLMGAACHSAGSDANEKEAASTDRQAVQADAQTSPDSADETALPPPRSLDELLPQKLELLVDAWHGDLDAMLERRVIRVLVVSGSPQFFYFRGKPRGMVSELLAMFQRDLNASLRRYRSARDQAYA